MHRPFIHVLSRINYSGSTLSQPDQLSIEYRCIYDLYTNHTIENNTAGKRQTNKSIGLNNYIMPKSSRSIFNRPIFVFALTKVILAYFQSVFIHILVKRIGQHYSPHFMIYKKKA